MANKSFEPYKAKIKTRLNVRKSASLTADIVRVLEKDAIVEVLGKTKEFGRIGTREYVMLKFTERVD